MYLAQPGVQYMQHKQQGYALSLQSDPACQLCAVARVPLRVIGADKLPHSHTMGS